MIICYYVKIVILVKILDYFDKAKDEGRLSDQNVWQIADQVIFAKVLPRIRGEESEKLKQVLKQVSDMCVAKDQGKMSIICLLNMGL